MFEKIRYGKGWGQSGWGRGRDGDNLEKQGKITNKDEIKKIKVWTHRYLTHDSSRCFPRVKGKSIFALVEYRSVVIGV